VNPTVSGTSCACRVGVGGKNDFINNGRKEGHPTHRRRGRGRILPNVVMGKKKGGKMGSKTKSWGSSGRLVESRKKGGGKTEWEKEI